LWHLQRRRRWSRRTGISITITPSDRRRLEAIVGDRDAPQKHAWGAAIVLLTAAGMSA